MFKHIHFYKSTENQKLLYRFVDDDGGNLYLIGGKLFDRIVNSGTEVEREILKNSVAIHSLLIINSAVVSICSL